MAQESTPSQGTTTRNGGFAFTVLHSDGTPLVHQNVLVRYPDERIDTAATDDAGQLSVDVGPPLTIYVALPSRYPFSHVIADDAENTVSIPKGSVIAGCLDRSHGKGTFQVDLVPDAGSFLEDDRTLPDTVRAYFGMRGAYPTHMTIPLTEFGCFSLTGFPNAWVGWILPEPPTVLSRPWREQQGLIAPGIRVVAPAVDLSLVPCLPVAIVGTVVTEQGRPLENVAITATMLSGKAWQTGVAVSRSDGSFELMSVSPSVDEVVVTLASEQTYRLNLGEGRDLGNLVLDSRMKVIVSVLDADGNSIEGAEVVSGDHTIRTDANGKAGFYTMLPADVRLTAKGYVPERLTASVPGELVARLRRAATHRFRIVDSSGLQVDFFGIRIDVDELPLGPGAYATSRWSSDGEFVTFWVGGEVLALTGLECQEMDVGAVDPFGNEVLRQAVDLSASGGDVQLLVTTTRRTISGTVCDGSGSGVPEAAITVFGDGGEQRGFANASGDFVIVGFCGSVVGVEAEKEGLGRAYAEQDASVNKRMRIVLGSGRRVDVRLLPDTVAMNREPPAVFIRQGHRLFTGERVADAVWRFEGMAEAEADAIVRIVGGELSAPVDASLDSVVEIQIPGGELAVQCDRRLESVIIEGANAQSPVPDALLSVVNRLPSHAVALGLELFDERGKEVWNRRGPLFDEIKVGPIAHGEYSMRAWVATHGSSGVVGLQMKPLTIQVRDEAQRIVVSVEGPTVF